MVSSGNRPEYGIAGIELKNINKSFGKLEVLRDLSLSIRQAELCCLLGPSGCGKTTALKIINGLLEANEGKVYLMGKDITSVAPQKRNLGMVFQNYALFPQMNVFDNIAYGLRRRKFPAEIIKDKVITVLKLVRLQGVEKRRIHELSGGQQQRIALARALVIEPQALLLDEPLSNLDAKLRADMREEIKHIQRQLGITTVYVTHDQEEAMSIADRIMVMNNGDIEQIGTPQEIYENPATRFVATFIGNMNFIPGKVDNGELQLLGNIYHLPAKSTIPSGDILCAVRPERIGLGLVDNSTIQGKINEKIYLGSIVRYDITVNDGTMSLVLTAQVPTSQEIVDIGDNIGIKIDYNDIRFFNE